MKKSKLWIVLSLVLIFAAGIVGGIFGERWILAKKPDGRRPGPSERYPSHDRWAKDLGLTAEQQDKIREIFKKNDDRIKELQTDFFKHVGEMRNEIRKEIDAVLTPEQKRKNDAMIQKLEEERRKDKEKRDQRNTESPKKENSTKEIINEKEGDHRSGDSGGYRRSHPGVWPF